MDLTPALDPYNASNNGVNPHDVIFNTGNIGLGGAGVFEYSTNTGLHQLFGGNDSQAGDVDVANVSENDSAGTIKIQPDLNTALICQLNIMYVTGGLFAEPYIIVSGEIDLQFSHGGTQVTGTIVMAAQGMISGGSVAIAAKFTGTENT
jgi:hypothetical protein